MRRFARGIMNHRRNSPLPQIEKSHHSVITELKSRRNPFQVVGIGVVAALTLLCVLAISDPHFRGGFGFKIKPDGVEVNIDRR